MAVRERLGPRESLGGAATVLYAAATGTVALLMAAGVWGGWRLARFRPERGPGDGRRYDTEPDAGGQG